MERITLPNAPEGLSPMDAALDYSFDDGRYARVILEMSEGENDHFNIKAQAYEMDTSGNYKQAPKGYPSRTRQTNHTVARSSLGDTASLTPGWVRVAPQSQQSYSALNLPEGAVVADELPATGTIGDMVYVEPTLYAYSNGVARQIAEGKVQELRQVLQNSAPLSNLGFNHGAL